ncbi:arsenite S-adenosylmethyltransferase [Candidatus Poribacteria bacterium]|nr:MAG: arsenite S-adenosylmethyltransferase [Candidatus Poribacteria bacterium]
MATHNAEQIKTAVREHYADLVKSDESCCSPSNCCDMEIDIEASLTGESTNRNGYTDTQLCSIPADAVENSFGCGNPLMYADICEDDVVLDLGSGTGIDVLLAAQLVGESGRVIGIDMTPEMIEKARKNAEDAGAKNVEFRLGEIESMPVEDESVDWIISNCVINLAPDKDPVFREAHRVLKPGGRLLVSDIVANHLPNWLRSTISNWANCISGALPEDQYLDSIRRAGLEEIQVFSKSPYAKIGKAEVASIKVGALKPNRTYALQ